MVIWDIVTCSEDGDVGVVVCVGVNNDGTYENSGFICQFQAGVSVDWWGYVWV